MSDYEDSIATNNYADYEDEIKKLKGEFKLLHKVISNIRSLISADEDNDIIVFDTLTYLDYIEERIEEDKK